jgi:hypothetical protein
MVSFLQTDVVTFRDPLSRNAQTYRWWAERGLIHSEVVETGDYASHLVRDILLRLRSLQDMIGNTRRRGMGGFRADDVESYQRYIEKMIDLCKKAQLQGRPEIAASAKQASEAYNARKSSVLMTNKLAVCTF